MAIGVSQRLKSVLLEAISSGNKILFKDEARGELIIGPVLFGNLNFCAIIYNGADRKERRTKDREGLLFERDGKTYANFAGFSNGEKDTLGTVLILQPPKKEEV